MEDKLFWQDIRKTKFGFLYVDVFHDSCCFQYQNILVHHASNFPQNKNYKQARIENGPVRLRNPYSPSNLPLFIPR